MPRPTTDHVLQVLAKLRLRLRDGLHRPGDRFLSNRALALRFGVSYQTADRLLRALVDEGLLVRRAGSGTYIPGQQLLSEAHLLFHTRAQRDGSFGQRLLSLLAARLTRERIPHRITFVDPEQSPARPRSSSGFPVLWDLPALAYELSAGRQPLLLLNDTPPPGLSSIHSDAVSLDDYSGGTMAAELLRSTTPLLARPPLRVAVLAGPASDHRSRARVQGFLSVLPAEVFHADSWFVEAGLRIAPHLLGTHPEAVFCCNDRLAEALLRHCRDNDTPRPKLIGFDDAPIAERLHLTTIAIPWDALVTSAATLIRRRLTPGNPASPLTAMKLTLCPRPVVRD